ncbi:hypothetical protein M0804_002775 [Polistes exclamans]|nr:hypothetical protein M0804_002775 [Polistes exclamans]
MVVVVVVMMMVVVVVVNGSVSDTMERRLLRLYDSYEQVSCEVNDVRHLPKGQPKIIDGYDASRELLRATIKALLSALVPSECNNAFALIKALFHFDTCRKQARIKSTFETSKRKFEALQQKLYSYHVLPNPPPPPTPPLQTIPSLR